MCLVLARCVSCVRAALYFWNVVVCAECAWSSLSLCRLPLWVARRFVLMACDKTQIPHGVSLLLVCARWCRLSPVL